MAQPMLTLKCKSLGIGLLITPELAEIGKLTRKGGVLEVMLQSGFGF